MNHLTEEETKKKWCPFANARLIRPETAALNDCCLASECMAWRWGAPLYADSDEVEPTVKVGFCGLAGKPTP